MGVDRTDYIVYGWKLPYDIQDANGQNIDFWDNKFRPMIEGQRGVIHTIVRDGMTRDYTVFGVRIKSDHDQNVGWEFEHLDIMGFDQEELIADFRRLFNPSEEFIKAIGKPTVFIFSHFS